MGHTIQQKSRLLARVRRIRGQVEAIERALEAEQGCAEVLQLVAATRGAMNGLMGEIAEEHVRAHVAAPGLAADERHQAADELVQVIRTYLK
jgi:DNA-binding FrmR family transcriptional regulator